MKKYKRYPLNSSEVDTVELRDQKGKPFTMCMVNIDAEYSAPALMGKKYAFVKCADSEESQGN